jgi:hypothetical protein
MISRPSGPAPSGVSPCLLACFFCCTHAHCRWDPDSRPGDAPRPMTLPSLFFGSGARNRSERARDTKGRGPSRSASTLVLFWWNRSVAHLSIPSCATQQWPVRGFMGHELLSVRRRCYRERRGECSTMAISLRAPGGSITSCPCARGCGAVSSCPAVCARFGLHARG